MDESLLIQTYEPLGTVSVARAVIMTFKDTVTSKIWTATACCVRREPISRSVGDPSTHYINVRCSAAKLRA